MRVIKYFYEEPTLLDFPESASESPIDSGERFIKLMREKTHHRGYLAASDLVNNTVGGSSLEDQVAAKALADVLDGPIWFVNLDPTAGNALNCALETNRAAIVRSLVTMSSTSVLISNLNPNDDVLGLLTTDRKASFGAIVRLLDMGATVVFPEPAHVGHDWSIFSAKPLSARFTEALRKAPVDCRAFVVPYVKARGEHKFYFEQYDLGLFSEYEVKR
ncbi:hypothetical protein HQ496_13610 [bacterium]|nr:hypothetical protein [bacterium]